MDGEQCRSKYGDFRNVKHGVSDGFVVANDIGQLVGFLPTVS